MVAHYRMYVKLKKKIKVKLNVKFHKFMQNKLTSIFFKILGKSNKISYHIITFFFFGRNHRLSNFTRIFYNFTCKGLFFEISNFLLYNFLNSKKKILLHPFFFLQSSIISFYFFFNSFSSIKL